MLEEEFRNASIHETGSYVYRKKAGGERRMAKDTVDTVKQEGFEEQEGCCFHQKGTPRKEQELKQLKNRLSRMAGQLNGIGKMLDENRYCGDVLIQVAAVQSALQAFAYQVLREHMETCVVEEIRKGNTDVVDEAVELMKKLKV